MRAFVIETSTSDGESRATCSLKNDIPPPVPREGEALIRVLRAGVCNTDLELMAGYMGFTGIVGHEFVGVVEEVNNSRSGSTESDNFAALVGKRVVGEINLACTRCHVCEGGGDRARNHCPERTVLGILGKHGTYAEYLTLPCRNLHVVPDSVSDAAAVFAEPLAAACRIIEQGLAPPEAAVAILGDGKLGLLAAEVLARRKAETGSFGASATSSLTTLIGRHKDKMELCCGTRGRDVEGVDGIGQSHQGASADGPTLTRVDASDQSTVQSLAGSFDVVVDATGSPQGLSSASELCRPLGTVVLKSTCAAGAGFNAAPVVINEQRVVGSRCGPFETALEMLATEGGIDVERYISGVFPLANTDVALEAARKRGALKVQITCSTASEE